MRYLKKLYLKYFLSPSFYVAIVLFFIMCLLAKSAMILGEHYSVFELITDSDLFYEAKTSFSCNSFFLLNSFLSLEWFIVALPVISGFPAVAIYSNYCEPSRVMILSRTSRRSYSTAVIMSSFFGGVMIAISGILLYAVVVYSVFPEITEFSAEYLQGTIFGSQIERITLFLPKTANVVIVSGLLSVVAVTVFCFIKDKFMSLSLPMMIMYVSMKLTVLYSGWIAQDPSRYDDKALNSVYLLFLSSAAQVYYLMEQYLGISHYFYYLFTAIILSAFIHLFKRIGTKV